MYSFFAMVGRMKYIDRWGLMRNTQKETLSEHTLETAVLAHALAVIGNKRLQKNYNCEKIALYAIYHDVPEILTGDLPTPIKYLNPSIKSAFDDVEKVAINRLISMLPKDFQEDFQLILTQDNLTNDEKKIIKAADKLSAYVKCLDEKKSGNTEFLEAEASTLNALNNMKIPEIEIFKKEFLPAYLSTLDGISLSTKI